MEGFKKLLLEKKNDTSSYTDTEDSFSILLTDIELCTNFQHSFKSNRNIGIILHQELNACQRECDEQKRMKAQYYCERNELLSSLNEKKALMEMEADKNRLNAMKRCVKLMWVNAPDDYLEGFVFNERTGYLNHFSYEITDSSIRQKLRNEINRAANHTYTNNSILF